VLVRRSVAGSVVLAVVVLVVAAYCTSLLGVGSVEVTGTRDLTSDQVLAAAAVAPGTPMLRLDVGGIEARVRQLPRVFQVDVIREWPGTVRIDVTERDPVAYLAARDGSHLVDITGVDYATVSTPPPGLPKVLLPSVSPSDQRTLAVVHVLAALPAQLRPLLLTVGAQTPGSVTLGLTGGRTIRWGSAADSGLKAEVLAALMTRPGRIYDVSSPELPTVS
jgi:cell division protein FtsQ